MQDMTDGARVVLTPAVTRAPDQVDSGCGGAEFFGEAAAADWQADDFVSREFLT